MTCGARVASLGDKLVEDLFQSFAEHGQAAIVRVRAERPCDYLRIIAAMVPKQLELSGGAMDGISNLDLELLISGLKKAQI